MIPQPVHNRSAQFHALIPGLPEGDIAEFGVFDGGSTVQLLGFGRAVHAFDTFEGMPQSGYSAELDEHNPPGKFKPSHDVVEYLESKGVVCHKGRFADTLPALQLRIAFAYVDCDWYSSYIEVLEYLLQHMVPGGTAILDDYNYCAGARKAVDETLAAHPQLAFDPVSSILRFP